MRDAAIKPLRRASALLSPLREARPHERAMAAASPASFAEGVALHGGSFGAPRCTAEEFAALATVRTAPLASVVFPFPRPHSRQSRPCVVFGFTHARRGPVSVAAPF